MPSSQDDLVAKLLDLFEDATVEHVKKPWGHEVVIDLGICLLKYIEIHPGMRTSLQYHERKDEVTIALEEGSGRREVNGQVYTRVAPVRVRPGQLHRVYGAIKMIELTTHDNDDVVRVEDDYGR